ncbi:MAG TPA: GntR family transcriptional regulator [Sphingobium sp.]|uniref:FadR/GntR family transcriptional regulator n=1 Tax=Sphingobium sp. TaxID=1912891 RepID=UPI002ED5D18B
MDSWKGRPYKGQQMRMRTQDSAMSAAATQLRAMIIDKDDGSFLGGEREVQDTLGISRTTLRQVARLLEREGVLVVKRGSNGGYFACRPSLTSIESAITAHLESLEVRPDELSTMASVIWIEAVRQAASLRNDTAKALTKKLMRLVRSIEPTISYRELVTTEQRIRIDVFELIDSPYMWFIFKTNISFAEKRFQEKRSHQDSHDDISEFVARWRSLKLLELEAISLGDPEMAVLAAHRTRNIWLSMIRESSHI